MKEEPEDVVTFSQPRKYKEPKEPPAKKSSANSSNRSKRDEASPFRKRPQEGGRADVAVAADEDDPFRFIPQN